MVAAALFYAIPASASETKIYPNSSGGITVEYASGKKIQLNKEATENVKDAIAGASVESGLTGQKYSTLSPTSPSVDVKVAEEVAKEVESKTFSETYKVEAYNFEEDLAQLDSTDGTLPLAADAIPYGGILLAAGGTFYVGYKIGEQIAFVLGLNGTGSEKLEGCGCGNVYISPKLPGEKVDIGKYETKTGTTTVEVEAPAGTIGYYHHTGYGYGSATEGWIQSVLNWSEKCKEPSSNPEWMEPPNGAVISIYKVTNTFCEHGPSEAEGNPRYETKFASVLATFGQAQLKGATRRGIESYGWPSKSGLSKTGLHETREVGTVKPLEHAPPKPTVITQTEPHGPSVTPEATPRVTTYVITKYVTDGGTGVEGTPEKTLAPELPKPRPNEVGTEYKTELETDGWTKVKLNTLTETATDPEVGPEDVAYTIPGSGSHVEYSTEVTVEQNPSTAPAPAEPTEGIGSPTLPGIKIPNFAVLCKGFPFGVPCWLIKTVETWSVSATCPTWEIGPFTIKSHEIPAGRFELCRLEPIMEYARPAMLIFATVGLILLFYKFATKGGGPESGAGIEDTSSTRESGYTRESY